MKKETIKELITSVGIDESVIIIENLLNEKFDVRVAKNILWYCLGILSGIIVAYFFI